MGMEWLSAKDKTNPKEILSGSTQVPVGEAERTSAAIRRQKNVMDIAYRLSEKSGMLQDEHAEHAAAAKYWLKEGPDGQSLASKYNNYMRTHDPAKVKVMSDDDVFDAIKGDAGNHGKTLGELDRSGILN